MAIGTRKRLPKSETTPVHGAVDKAVKAAAGLERDVRAGVGDVESGVRKSVQDTADAISNFFNPPKKKTAAKAKKAKAKPSYNVLSSATGVTSKKRSVAKAKARSTTAVQRRVTGSTKRTRAVAKIAANKNISRAKARKLQAKRRARPGSSPGGDT